MIYMNQETNDFLRENLTDAHTIFNSILKEMQEVGIPYEYEAIKQSEQIDYNTINELLIKMNKAIYEYDNLMSDNEEFFDGRIEYYVKYISLYILSLLLVNGFNKLFNTEDLDKLWYFVIGLFFGSTFIGLLNKDLHEYQSDNLEKRNLINRLKTLKEEYKENHDKAVIMIDYIFALNDRLWNELDNGKKLIKK